MTLLGQYDVWIRKGAISIAGALLHASSRLHRVYASSTHSLPSMHPIPNPYGPQNVPAEITIHSCASGIRLLKHLSPKYGRIWNHKHVSSGADPRELDLSQRSFVLVSPVGISEDGRTLTLDYSSILQQTIRTKDLCMLLSHCLTGE